MLHQADLSLALKIDRAIADSRLSSKRIAELCGVSPQAVNGWKRTGRISKESLAVLVQVVGQPLEHFMCGSAVPGNSNAELAELTQLFAVADQPTRQKLLAIARVMCKREMK